MSFDKFQVLLIFFLSSIDSGVMMMMVMMMMMMMMYIVFVVWLTNERRLSLFPGGTIVRDPHHRKSPTAASRI